MNETTEQLKLETEVIAMKYEIYYRTWLDNGDAYTVPRSQIEVMDDVESEMGLTASTVLITRGDLNKADILKALDHLRFLVERAGIP